MKILFITNDYFPYTGANSNIICKLLFEGELLKKVNEVHVLTISKKYDDPPDEIKDGVHIHRIYSSAHFSAGDLIRMIREHTFFSLQLLCKKVMGKGHGLSFIDAETSAGFVKRLRKGDFADFDYIISVCGGCTNAEAALKYFKMPGKNIRAKFGIYQLDPCSTNTTYKEEYDFLCRYERKLYSCADFVICTPIIMKEQSSILEEKMLTKFHAMEFPLVTGNIKKEDEEKEKIICLFSGTIYSDIRDPVYTLKLFKEIKNPNISFEMVGVSSEQLPGELKSLAKCYGMCDLDFVKRKMEECSILVNIGNKMKNQVPSKLFEYISTGKPIINICKNRDCPTLDYMTKYPLALNLYEEDDLLHAQGKEMENFINRNQKSRMEEMDIFGAFRKCTAEYCANHLIEILKDNTEKFKNT